MARSTGPAPTDSKNTDYEMYNFSLRKIIRDRLKVICETQGIKVYAALEKAIIMYVHQSEKELGLPKTNFTKLIAGGEDK